MLSGMNRAKNMRVANQILKEQQQESFAIQSRREKGSSMSKLETRKKLTL